MVYKKPKMLLLELEEEDIVTLSNQGGDTGAEGTPDIGDGSGDDWGDDGW